MRKNLKMIKCPELSPEQLAAGRERRRRDLERCEMRGPVYMQGNAGKCGPMLQQGPT